MANHFPYQFLQNKWCRLKGAWSVTVKSRAPRDSWFQRTCHSSGLPIHYYWAFTIGTLAYTGAVPTYADSHMHKYYLQWLLMPYPFSNIYYLSVLVKKIKQVGAATRVKQSRAERNGFQPKFSGKGLFFFFFLWLQYHCHGHSVFT